MIGGLRRFGQDDRKIALLLFVATVGLVAVTSGDIGFTGTKVIILRQAAIISGGFTRCGKTFWAATCWRPSQKRTLTATGLTITSIRSWLNPSLPCPTDSLRKDSAFSRAMGRPCGLLGGALAAFPSA